MSKQLFLLSIVIIVSISLYPKEYINQRELINRGDSSYTNFYSLIEIEEDKIDSEWRVGDCFPSFFYKESTVINTITIVNIDSQNGQWFYRTNKSSGWTEIPDVDTRQIEIGLDDYIRFAPNPDYNSQKPVVMTVVETYNQSNMGELNIYVKAVNDAPIINPDKEIVILDAVSEDIASENNYGESLYYLFNECFNDERDNQIDNSGSFPNYLDGVLVIDNIPDSQKGRWQYTIDNNIWIDIPICNLSHSLVLMDAKNTKLRFNPALDYYGDINDVSKLKLCLIESSHSDDLISGQYINIESDKLTGDTTRFSDAYYPIILKTSINPVNDAPLVMKGRESVIKQIDRNEGGEWNVSDLFKNSFDDSKDAPDSDEFDGVLITEIGNKDNAIWWYKSSNQNDWVKIVSASEAGALYLKKDDSLRFESNIQYSNLDTLYLKIRLYESGGDTLDSGMNLNVTKFDPTGKYSYDAVTLYINIRSKIKPIIRLNDNQQQTYTGKQIIVEPAILSNIKEGDILPVRYEYLDTNSNEVQYYVKDAGVYAVTAYTSANDDYYEAQSNTITLSVNKAIPVINFPYIGDKKVGSSPFLLNVTSSSSQPIIYSSSDTSIAEVSEDGVVSIKRAGSVTISASQFESENYLSRSTTRTLNVVSNNADLKGLAINSESWDIDNIYYVVDCSYTGDSLSINIQTEDNAIVSIAKSFSVDVSKPLVKVIKFSVTSQDRTVTKNYKFTIEKYFAFDDLVTQKWNNTLAVNNNKDTNGGYKFIAYKWFKNNVEVVGSRGYYSAGSRDSDLLDPSDKYYVQVTADNGQTFRTCEASPILKSMSIKAYPNPVTVGNPIYLETDLDQDAIDRGTIEIYSILGNNVSKNKVEGKVTPLKLPNSPGTYILYVRSGDLVKEIKVIVK